MNDKNINNFDKIRKKKNFSQVMLANTLNLKQGTISMWEQGKSYPSIPTIHKIAKILGESPTTIFECFEVTNDK